MCARVLVVDDDPVNVDLIGYLLSAFGHDPVLALRGDLAVLEARERIPDLVLCDIQMPEMDGFEVLRRLRQDTRLAKTPIVGVTALAMVGDREKVLAAGFDGYLTKPIMPETFVEEIEKYLPKGMASQRLPQPATPVAEAAAAPRWRSVGYALVVDDNAPNRDLLRHLIGSLGVEVRTASNVDEALSLAQQATPNLIISDLHMPERDGLELLDAVKADATLKGVPFLLISASAASQNEERRAMKAGADDFLRRPLDAEAMLEHLIRWISLEPER